MIKTIRHLFFWIKSGIKILILFVLFVVCLVFIYRSLDHFPTTVSQRKTMVIENLISLRHSLRDENASVRMQELFPEGACFTNTLYGLARTNIARQFPQDHELQSLAIKEASWIFKQYDKPYVSQFFDNTQVKNGIFWLGQKNLLLGQLLEIIPEDQRPTDYINEFHDNSQKMGANPQKTYLLFNFDMLHVSDTHSWCYFLKIDQGRVS